MIPLPTEFDGRGEQRGFRFHMICREGNLALFEKQKPSQPKTYEVVRIRQSEEWEIGGRMVPARELMPNAEQWGTLGWSLMTMDKATQKFLELMGSK